MTHQHLQTVIKSGIHTGISTERLEHSNPGAGAAMPLDGSQWLVGPDPDLRPAGTTSTASTASAADVGLRVAVHGLHGGAGTSTIAAMLRSQGVAAHEGGHLQDGRQPGDGTNGADVSVLVLRTTAPATALLHRSLLTWRAQLGAPPVLITVPDIPTGAMPAAARYRLRAMRGDFRGPITVPWLWPLREADHYDQISTTKKARNAARQLVDDLARTTATTLGK